MTVAGGAGGSGGGHVYRVDFNNGPNSNHQRIDSKSRRPQSANSHSQQTQHDQLPPPPPLSDYQQPTSNNRDALKESEIFGQHLLRSRRDQVQNNEEFFAETTRPSDDRVGDDCDINEFDEDSSEAALMAVASAEEYAAKIIKLQQACLIPLKEDLADWLNKVLKTSQMTTSNFMDKLDNGVIICRLAKVISLWCQQQLQDQDENTVSSEADKLLNTESSYGSERSDPRTIFQDSNCAVQTFYSPLKVSSTTSQSTNCLIRSSASATSLNNGLSLYHSNQFINNLIRMNHIKIWEDARCRTFYARDNVCNFIKWSENFGVNRSVLFESDDLVLHANPRQVVLCLLDVARIAYVKYGFTEAPGLVKFEQEIDRELALERNKYLMGDEPSTYGDHPKKPEASCDKSFDVSTSDVGRSSSKGLNRARASIGDATDELVLRYCRHKEELKKLDEQQQQSQEISINYQTGQMNVHANKFTSHDKHCQSMSDNNFTLDSLVPNYDQGKRQNSPDDLISSTADMQGLPESEVTNFMSDRGRVESLDSGEGPTESASTANSNNRSHGNSANIATTDDQDTSLMSRARENGNPSQLPSHPITTTTSNSITENSELSSSRSSLSSNHDCNNSTSNYGRQITSDLDGKVMRIAKSYYGKKATKDVTRLSEGKYKIADRIVFVRLLKGHRVMVRIGGGWDTLENFLFRHKSDPTQVIDPDNLLPLETKVSLEKSAQVTPRGTPLRSPGPSRLPSYHRSSSASSTNLSQSNLSFSNLSLASSQHHSNNPTPSRRIPTARLNNGAMMSMSYSSSPSVDQTPPVRRQIPCLLVHKGQLVNRSPRNPYGAYNGLQKVSDTPISSEKQPQQKQHLSHVNSNAQATTSSSYSTPQDKSAIRKPSYYSHTRTPSQQQQQQQQRIQKFNSIAAHHSAKKSIHLHRPLASSRAPTFSVTNLYPATLTTSMGPGGNNRFRI